MFESLLNITFPMEFWLFFMEIWSQVLQLPGNLHFFSPWGQGLLRNQWNFQVFESFNTP